MEHSALKPGILWRLSGFDYNFLETLILLDHLSISLFLYHNHPNSVGPLLYSQSFACHTQRGGVKVNICPFLKCLVNSHFACVLRRAKLNRRNFMWVTLPMCVCVSNKFLSFYPSLQYSSYSCNHDWGDYNHNFIGCLLGASHGIR